MVYGTYNYSLWGFKNQLTSLGGLTLYLSYPLSYAAGSREFSPRTSRRCTGRSTLVVGRPPKELALDDG